VETIKRIEINLIDIKLATCYLGHGNNIETIVKTSKKNHLKVVITISNIERIKF